MGRYRETLLAWLAAQEKPDLEALWFPHLVVGLAGQTVKGLDSEQALERERGLLERFRREALPAPGAIAGHAEACKLLKECIDRRRPFALFLPDTHPPGAGEPLQQHLAERIGDLVPVIGLYRPGTRHLEPATTASAERRDSSALPMLLVSDAEACPVLELLLSEATVILVQLARSPSRPSPELRMLSRVGMGEATLFLNEDLPSDQRADLGRQAEGLGHLVDAPARSEAAAEALRARVSELVAGRASSPAATGEAPAAGIPAAGAARVLGLVAWWTRIYLREDRDAPAAVLLALASLARLPPAPEEESALQAGRLHLALVDALVDLPADNGRLVDAALARAEAIVSEFDSRESRSLVADLALRRANYAALRGAHDDALQAYDSARRCYEGLDDRENVAVTWLGEGALREARGEIEHARSGYREAIALFAELGDESKRSDVEEMLSRLPPPARGDGPATSADPATGGEAVRARDAVHEAGSRHASPPAGAGRAFDPGNEPIPPYFGYFPAVVDGTLLALVQTSFPGDPERESMSVGALAEKRFMALESLEGDATSNDHVAAATAVQDAVVAGRPFGLYLRNFALGASVRRAGAAPDGSPRVMTFGYRQDRELQQLIVDAVPRSAAFQFVSIANRASYGEPIPSLVLPNDGWEGIAELLIGQAGLIVVYFLTSSPGVQREFDLLRTARAQSRTLIVVADEDPRDHEMERTMAGLRGGDLPSPGATDAGASTGPSEPPADFPHRIRLADENGGTPVAEAIRARIANASAPSSWQLLALPAQDAPPFSTLAEARDRALAEYDAAMQRVEAGDGVGAEDALVRSIAFGHWARDPVGRAVGYLALAGVEQEMLKFPNEAVACYLQALRLFASLQDSSEIAREQLPPARARLMAYLTSLGHPERAKWVADTFDVVADGQAGR